ncbi:MAG: hypothetical protein MUF02_03555 [Acidobacteria bacterium]|nr:hypothetical protein [Acidobacteriota bacterium]
MKRILLTLVILQALFAANAFASVSQEQSEKAAAAVVAETIKLTPDGEQNWRHPAICEDSRGNRLAIFRGPEGISYYYSYCPKNGSWTAPAPINNGIQPKLGDSLYANMAVDSYDRFHCTWEEADGNWGGVVYASFKDGVWTTPYVPWQVGRYDLINNALGVRSDDSLIYADCEVQGFSKEIYLHTKGKDEPEFGEPFNATRDEIPGSTQPSLAIDADDNTWLAWKSDLLIPDVDENLVIYMAQFDKNNNDIGDWILLSSSPAWSFLPQIAINNEGKIMTTWAFPSGGDFVSRLYDPATQDLSEQIYLETNLVRAPWHTFFHRLVSHGKDFFAAVIVPGRSVPVMQFNWTTSKWDEIYRLPEGVDMLGMHAGYDKLLIAWSTWIEPTGVYLTSIGIEPWMAIRIRSVSNLQVALKEERSFFQSKWLNALTWEANPENTEKGIAVTEHRIYRKNRADDDTKWVKIAEVAGTVLKFDDDSVASDSDYVYAVTCVDDQERESKIF